MNPANISFTTEWNLCSGCGICVGVCPKHCIDWKWENGMYQPVIDQNSCVSCGLCVRICPGLGQRYETQPDCTAARGKVILSCNAWSRSPEIRHVSASGGVVSTLVLHLLESGDYDVAFLIDSYDYHQQLSTKPVTMQDVQDMASSSYPKSRYLPVSHENTIAYVKCNRTKKVICVGTSCAIRGILSVMEQLHLPRENYLLIGLFCDRVFNYNVVDYYQRPDFCGNKKLERLHFKNKESGGWPGNMKFFFSDGSTAYQDKSERTKVKDYFMPERCLYCIDKLNVCADISLGDNYTQQNSSLLGSNSVIIRTEIGLDAWQKTESLLESSEVPIEQIMEAQYVDWRLNNLCYGKLKEQEILQRTGQEIVLNTGVTTNRKIQEYRERWKNSLQMLRAGEHYRDHPEELQKQMDKAEKSQNQGTVRRFFSKAYHFVKRRIGKVK